MKSSISVKASLVAALLSLGLVSLEVGAQTLTRLTTESQRIPMNTPVTILLEYRVKDQNWCGVTVDYGNGSRDSIRIGHEQDTASPIRRTVTFSAVGTYTIRAEGTALSRGLRSAVPCEGSVQPLVLTVFDLAAEKEKERAAAEARMRLDLERRARIKAEETQREKERAAAEAQVRLEVERQARIKAEEAQRQSEQQRRAMEARELDLKRKELEAREQALRREEAARRQPADRKPAAEAAPAARPPVRAADGF